jgi:hypothetical protein
MSDTVYINALRCKKTQYGTKISINVEKFIEELKSHQNDRGYVNIEIKEKKAPDQYGYNAFAVLDTWKPNKDAVQPAAPQTSKKTDDLPF